MSNQTSHAQRPLSMLSDEIQGLQSEMARLTAHIARLTAQQMMPALRNLKPSMQHIQKDGDHPSGGHVRTCSFHRRCTHNDTIYWAQSPNSAYPSDAARAHTSLCYFC
uniref:Uncharacterized protein n=1 Tax=Romanomermis culicivorax TaxID=13658 RepID=A0A915I7W3_ROMCU